MGENKSYSVGYGKPPKGSQFGKGQSGNPKGRPKGVINLATIVHKISSEPVTVTVNGCPVRMSRLEASIHQLANKAATGDLKAIRELLYWARLCEEIEESGPSTRIPDQRDRSVMVGILKRLGQAGKTSIMEEKTAIEAPVEEIQKT